MGKSRRCGGGGHAACLPDKVGTERPCLSLCAGRPLRPQGERGKARPCGPPIPGGGPYPLTVPPAAGKVSLSHSASADISARCTTFFREHNIWRPNVMFAAAKKGPGPGRPLRAVRSRPPWRVWPQRSRQAGLGGAGGGSERGGLRPLSVRAAGPWRPETSVGADAIQSAPAAPCERARSAVLHGPRHCYAGSFGLLPGPPYHIATGTLPHCQRRVATLPETLWLVAERLCLIVLPAMPHCQRAVALLPKRLRHIGTGATCVCHGPCGRAEGPSWEKGRPDGTGKPAGTKLPGHSRPWPGKSAKFGRTLRRVQPEGPVRPEPLPSSIKSPSKAVPCGLQATNRGNSPVLY